MADLVLKINIYLVQLELNLSLFVGIPFTLPSLISKSWHAPVWLTGHKKLFFKYFLDGEIMFDVWSPMVRVVLHKSWNKGPPLFPTVLQLHVTFRVQMDRPWPSISYWMLWTIVLFHMHQHTRAYGSSFAQLYLLCVCACVFYTVLKTAPFFSPSEHSIGPVGVHSCDVRTSSSSPDNTGDHMSPSTSQTPARLLFVCLCNTASGLS